MFLAARERAGVGVDWINSRRPWRWRMKSVAVVDVINSVRFVADEANRALPLSVVYGITAERRDRRRVGARTVSTA